MMRFAAKQCRSTGVTRLRRFWRRASAYQAVTTRRISFEYAMIDGVKRQRADAAQLASLLKGALCHVNLIPVNNVAERDYVKSSPAAIETFIKILEKAGITATVRRSLGRIFRLPVDNCVKSGYNILELKAQACALRHGMMQKTVSNYFVIVILFKG